MSPLRGDPGALQTAHFGPFTKGVLTPGNPALALAGTLMDAANVHVAGPGRVTRRPGWQVATPAFPDPAGAPCTTVCWVGAYGDGLAVLAHQAAGPNAGRLYWFTGASDGTGFVRQGLVYAGTGPTPPDVSATELLGALFVAHAAGVVQGGTAFPVVELAPGKAAKPVTGALPDVGAVLYGTGLVAFKSHLWVFGYGSPSDPWRPELARYSQPFLTPLTDQNGQPTADLFAASDSFGVGDRLRSARERIVGGCVAGDALFLGGVGILTEITGVDRDSWYRRPVDSTAGFAGPRAMLAVGGACYFWTERGPARVAAGGAVEPLWEPVRGVVAEVRRPSAVVAAFDSERDTLYFVTPRSDRAEPRVLCGFSLALDAWVDVRGDLGVAVASAATVTPVYSSAQPPPGPGAVPRALAVQSVSQSTAQLTFTPGDPLAETLLAVQLRAVNGSPVDGAWGDDLVLAPGAVARSLTALAQGATYGWRASHRRNGQVTPPVEGPAFTTAGADQALPRPQGVTFTPASELPGERAGTVRWGPGPESGVAGVVELLPPGGAWAVWGQGAPDALSLAVAVSDAGAWAARVTFRLPGAPDSAPSDPAPATFR